MIWRYVPIGKVKSHERAGWVHADRFEKTRNQYFVLMLWENTNGN